MEIKRIEDLLSGVLKKAFPSDFTKQKIYLAGNRMNFSCPYCGDSNNSKKKRGNFYLNTLSFKCYNGGCGMFKDGYTLFRDFGVNSELNQSERTEILEVIKEGRDKRRTVYGDVDISLFFDADFKKVVIPRSKFMEMMGLEDVKGSSIETYVLRRNQLPDKRFAWDHKGQKLYLLNLTREDDILGLQVRNMSSTFHGAKYYTYKLSGIWEKLLGVKDPEFLDECTKIDPVSHVFNIGFISFDQKITIFEGPMDSWLWSNSVGLCSIENKFPFEFDNVQYWYDWDKAGKEKTSELLSKGHMVFNWKRFLDDHALPINKKWDLNDLVNYLRAKKIKVKRFENYFTHEVLDLTYFMDV
jgi:hypothetical protein